MTITGTIEEINHVLHFLRPDFQKQNLESIESGECFYIMNGVEVKIIIKGAEE